jgi:hypothetical protein
VRSTLNFEESSFKSIIERFWMGHKRILPRGHKNLTGFGNLSGFSILLLPLGDEIDRIYFIAEMSGRGYK